MIDINDINLYLPKYLSSESYTDLINCLKDFPDNIVNRIYIYYNKEDFIYQGDGINNFIIVDVDDSFKIKSNKGKVIILSNTCDISLENKRYFPTKILYAPILSLSKYIKTLKNNNLNNEIIENHIKSIKSQHITQIFYLPKSGCLEDDGIVFLDRINNCSIKGVNKDFIKKERIFTLSNYGFYLFLFKLSIHFTRMMENIDRK